MTAHAFVLVALGHAGAVVCRVAVLTHTRACTRLRAHGLAGCLQAHAHARTRSCASKRARHRFVFMHSMRACTHLLLVPAGPAGRPHLLPPAKIQHLMPQSLPPYCQTTAGRVFLPTLPSTPLQTEALRACRCVSTHTVCGQPCCMPLRISAGAHSCRTVHVLACKHWFAHACAARCVRPYLLFGRGEACACVSM